MKINCIICKKEVENPTISQKGCGSKECTKKMGILWVEANRLKRKEYMRRYNKEYYKLNK